MLASLPQTGSRLSRFWLPIVSYPPDIIHYAYYQTGSILMDIQVSYIGKFACVEMLLHHVLYISYLVLESRVRGLVPKALSQRVRY